MNVLLLVVLLALLFISLFAIIPKYAVPGQDAIIQDWVGLGFNALLFGIVLYETSFKYRNVYHGIVFFLIAVAVAISGVYWWIPKYISPENQSNATKTMFTVLSISIIAVNIITQAAPVSFKKFW